MYLRTKEFSEAIGETYTAVRDVYGRPGREPRERAAGEFTFRSHRRFSWLDALAWRITRHLTQLGLTWDEAAAVVCRERVADRFVENADRHPYFGVWQTKCQTGFAAWAGTAAEIAEMVEHDSAKYGRTTSLRMISLVGADEDAREFALRAGLLAHDGNFWCIKDGEGE